MIQGTNRTTRHLMGMMGRFGYAYIFIIIAICWVGLEATKNPLWEGLILKKEKKIEYFEIGEKVVMYYQNSAKYAVPIKIKGVT